MASEKPGGLPIPPRAESIDAFLEVLQGFRGEAELQDFMMKMSIRGTLYSF